MIAITLIGSLDIGFRVFGPFQSIECAARWGKQWSDYWHVMEVTSAGYNLGTTIIMSGNLSDGWKAIGPFPSWDHAMEWEHQNWQGSNTWYIDMEDPDWRHQR